MKETYSYLKKQLRIKLLFSFVFFIITSILFLEHTDLIVRILCLFLSIGYAKNLYTIYEDLNMLEAIKEKIRSEKEKIIDGKN